ncbi:MAG: class I SAM-dependent methyltransferase [Acidobacteriota bacterium]
MTASQCPACDHAGFRSLFTASDRLYRTTREKFEVVECRSCGLLRLHPWPSPEQLRRYYPAGYWFASESNAADRLEEAWRRLVLCDHVEFVWRALGAAGEAGLVLDAGCGGGLFLRLLRERGLAVMGLDVSPAAAAIAWRRNGVPAACGTLESAPLPPGSCAAVTMFHLLEHLADPQRHLESAHALLRPRGRLIVQAPNAACWQFLLLGENWSGLDVPRHLIDYRAGDLERLLDCCGFEVLQRKYFSLRDNPTGLATSLAPWLDPMARRVRGLGETPARRLFKNLLYVALVVAALPFTLVEAACRAGSTIMVEARKKS